MFAVGAALAIGKIYVSKRSWAEKQLKRRDLFSFLTAGVTVGSIDVMAARYHAPWT